MQMQNIELPTFNYLHLIILQYILSTHPFCYGEQNGP